MIKMVPEWRSAWRMVSMRAYAAILLWLSLSDDIQAKAVSLLWDDATPAQVTALLAVVGAVGRLIVQRKVRGPVIEEDGRVDDAD